MKNNKKTICIGIIMLFIISGLSNSAGIMGVYRNQSKVFYNEPTKLPRHIQPPPPKFPICTANGSQCCPNIWGDRVVWQDHRSGEWDIYGYSLSTGVEFPICTHQGGQERPAIWWKTVVWQDHRSGDWDIYGYSLSTGVEFPICTHQGNQTEPAIWGDRVVWQDHRSGDWDIYGYSLSTGVEFPICTLLGNHQEQPDIWLNTVVWQDDRNGIFDICVYNLFTGQEFLIGKRMKYDPAVWGFNIVWEDIDTSIPYWEIDIYGFNLLTMAMFPISNLPFEDFHPDIWGKTVVYCNYHLGDILGYDLLTGGSFPITMDPTHQGFPSVWGKTVVWQDGIYFSDVWDIYGAELP